LAKTDCEGGKGPITGWTPLEFQQPMALIAKEGGRRKIAHEWSVLTSTVRHQVSLLSLPAFNFIGLRQPHIGTRLAFAWLDLSQGVKLT
jgi:hypothetical protein